MRRILISSLTLIAPLLFVQGAFAIEMTCPPTPNPVEATPDNIHAEIKKCIAARDARKEAAQNTPEASSYCPSGDATSGDKQPLTPERIAMQVGTSMLFAKIDEKAITKICALREMREKDAVKWTTYIKENFDASSAYSGPVESAPIGEQYLDICKNSGINVMNTVNANSDKKQWIATTNAFPQAICEAIAKAKADGWKKLGYILMTDGIAKGYQNDKDTFIDKIKTKYDNVREKLHSLLELLDKATANLTNLTKKTVK